jgi:ABC-2 type transport system ATP-binding protein
MRYVGGVIENPDLYKEWSAYENLMYLKSLSIDKNNQETFSKTLSKRKNEVLEVLKVVGLDSRMHDKVGHFSLGMKQRLGIAQAIMDNPKLLILDEPANGLDPAGIKEIRDMLRKCAEQLDMAVLVSSHQLAEMELMCDRFLIIDKGKITAEQKTSELTGGKEGTLRTIVVQVDKEKVDEVKVFLENYLKTEVLQKGDHVKFTTDKDISAITKELVINNFDVHSISPEKGRLEDTYLEATSKSKLGGRQ